MRISAQPMQILEVSICGIISPTSLFVLSDSGDSNDSGSSSEDDSGSDDNAEVKEVVKTPTAAAQSSSSNGVCDLCVIETPLRISIFGCLDILCGCITLLNFQAVCEPVLVFICVGQCTTKSTLNHMDKGSCNSLHYQNYG